MTHVIENHEIFTLILMAVFYGLTEGLGDTIAHSADYVTHGWKNKWRIDRWGHPVQSQYHTGGILKTIYYHLFNIKYVERFFMSSWMLVAFTDRWHLFNWFRRWAVYLTVCSLTSWWWGLLILPVARGIAFKFFYRNH